MIDIGANLAHDSFDADREQVFHDAWSAGLTGIVLTGSSFESNQKAADIAASAPKNTVWSTAGLHPHHAKEWDEAHDQQVRHLCQARAAIAVGETGLDYFRDFSPRDVQCEVFEAQLKIAVDLQLPLFLHQRDAHEDFFSLLKQYRPKLKEVVVHCFTGTAEELADYISADCHIGITGWICDERRGAHLLDCVGSIPENRLMIETDAPYLMPRTIRPKPKTRRNVPANLGYVAQTIADATGRSLEAIKTTTATNSRRFFRLEE